MSNYYTDVTEDDYGQVTSGVMHKADSSVQSSFVSEYAKGIQTGGPEKTVLAKPAIVSNMS